MVENQDNSTTVEASAKENRSEEHDKAKAELISDDEGEAAAPAQKSDKDDDDEEDEQFQDCLDEVQFAQQFEKPPGTEGPNDEEENKHSGSEGEGEGEGVQDVEAYEEGKE